MHLYSVQQKKQLTTNYKVVYLRCGGVVNNQIIKRFIAECENEKKIKIGEYLAKLQART